MTSGTTVSGQAYEKHAPHSYRSYAQSIMVFRIQPHSRLQEWVAEDKGYFRAEGLEYEFVTSLASSSVSTGAVRRADEAPIEVRRGALQEMSEGRAWEVSSACH